MSVDTAVPSKVEAAPARRRRAYRQDRNGPSFYIGINLLLLIFVVPLLWMVLTSFRTVEDSRRIPISIIPDELTLRAYKLMFADEQNPVYPLVDQFAAGGRRARRAWC